ncbi:sulfatase family protein [Elioraea sp.]|uniref:sulfatase family protein n=1 Tax=Elioraea sp. TaxID=2185103 RepID=UPI003F6FEA91
MTATPDRPNILWFCTDQQRWDTIGALGNPHIRTPVLDALSASGTAFSRTYTQSPICTPARASMMTGRYPASHHVYRNGNAYWPAHETLVTRLFADAGYDCGLIGKFHLSAAKYHEARPQDGYRVFLWNHHPTPDAARGDAYEHWLRHEKKIDPQALYRDKGAFCGPGVPAEYHQTTWCAEMAVRFVTDRRDGPFLLSINPFDPHAPFDAAPEYLAEVDPAALPLPLWRDSDAERWRDFERIDQQQKQPQDPRIRHPAQAPPAERDHDTVASHVPEGYDALAVKANYYAMIQHLDAAFGRIMQALRDSGQIGNTIVLYHSDHGEMLGDHGLVLKGCRFFEGLVRVPMIWSLPDRFHSGVVSEALVELVDIAPTLLEAAGLAVPEPMQGRSLLPILEGRADPHRHRPHVVAEFKDAIAGGGGDRSHGSMVFDGRWKSVVYHGHPVGEIFDHAADPGEFDNLWGDVALRAERLKAHVDALAATVSAGPPRVAAY